MGERYQNILAKGEGKGAGAQTMELNTRRAGTVELDPQYLQGFNTWIKYRRDDGPWAWMSSKEMVKALKAMEDEQAGWLQGGALGDSNPEPGGAEQRDRARAELDPGEEAVGDSDSRADASPRDWSPRWSLRGGRRGSREDHQGDGLAGVLLCARVLPDD